MLIIIVIMAKNASRKILYIKNQEGDKNTYSIGKRSLKQFLNFVEILSLVSINKPFISSMFTYI